MHTQNNNSATRYKYKFGQIHLWTIHWQTVNHADHVQVHFHCNSIASYVSMCQWKLQSWASQVPRQGNRSNIVVELQWPEKIRPIWYLNATHHNDYRHTTAINTTMLWPENMVTWSRAPLWEIVHHRGRKISQKVPRHTRLDINMLDTRHTTK